MRVITPPGLFAILAVAAAQVHGATVTIPTTYALPSSAADTSKPGFIWRVHETTTAEPNTIDFAEAQLAGLEGDNLADPTAQGVADAPSTAPSPATAPISFNISGVINLDKAGQDAGNIPGDGQMPGLPGTGGSTDNAAAEALTWLNLPTGDITMGVNSDDGFRVTIGGSSPSDRFAVDVGEYNGGRGASDTIFTFHIDKAGLYAARLLWENGTGGANVEWFTVSGTNHVLINDPVTPGAIKAYRAANGPSQAYATSFSPAPQQTVGPDAPINIVLADGPKPVAPASVKLSIDGAPVNATVGRTNTSTTITYKPAALWPSASTHTGLLTFSDTATPANTVTDQWTFSVITYRNIQLPQPIYFEDFEKTDLGSLPTGWTSTNNTDSINAGIDINDPKSDAYLGWLVIDRNQVFANGTNAAAVWEAGDPDGRVTTIAPGQVVNGVIQTPADLMVDKFVYFESDERGGNQVGVLFSPMYDLTGKSNLWVSYHSSYVQNQDNIASAEYSVDGGANWLPLVYMLDVPDIVLKSDGTVDAETTLNTPQGDTAFGTSYGTYIGAPITQALAPFISGRINDDKVESHRVEFFPLTGADNKSKVQLRFAYAGTGSWYWGIDDVGIYSVAASGSGGSGNAKFNPVVKNADGSLTISWTGSGTLQTSSTVNGTYTDVTGAASPYSVKAPLSGHAFFRIKQ